MWRKAQEIGDKVATTDAPKAALDKFKKGASDLIDRAAASEVPKEAIQKIRRKVSEAGDHFAHGEMGAKAVETARTLARHSLVRRFTAIIGRMLRRYPGKCALTAAGVLLLVGWAILQRAGNDSPVELAVEAAGAFDPKKAEEIYQKELELRSQEIIRLNRQCGEWATRKAMLEKAVRENAPGSDRALKELQEADKSDPAYAHLNKINQQRAILESQFEAVKKQQAELETAKKGGGTWSQKIWLRLTGSRPEHYDQEILRLQKTAAYLAMELRLANDLARRLMGGYTGKSAVIPARSDQEIISDFFRN